MTHCESCDSPPYFQHLLAPTNHPIYKAMLINQVLVDSVLRTNYLIIILTKANRTGTGRTKAAEALAQTSQLLSSVALPFRSSQ